MKKFQREMYMMFNIIDLCKNQATRKMCCFKICELIYAKKTFQFLPNKNISFSSPFWDNKITSH